MLNNPKIYVDWWGWNGSDPSNEKPAWRDFLEHLGGSRWLAPVEQYYDASGNAGNPTGLFTGDEWSDDQNTLPRSTQACTQNSQCASGQCDTQYTGTCYCHTDADCADALVGCDPTTKVCGKCDTTSGYCYPTRAQFGTETLNAEAHFNPGQDGIILIALPNTIPDPGYMRHDHQARANQQDLVWIEAHYAPAGTAGVDHEIAESITDPVYNGWKDGCGCEVADKCNPPPGGSVPAALTVGESVGTAGNYPIASLWANDRNYGSGSAGCVTSHVTHRDYFFVDCYGNLRHIDAANFGSGTIDNFGHLSGVALAYDYTAGPGAASWGNSRTDVFARDANGDVQHMYWHAPSSPGWNSWGAPSGYNVLYSPDAFSWRPQRIDVLVVGDSGSARHVFDRYWNNGTFSGWQDWGAPPGVEIASRPAVASWNVNRIDVFVLDTESPPHVWHGYSSSGTGISGWNDWGYVSGQPFLFGLDAASWGDNRVDVLALSSSNGYVYHRGWDHGTFSSWASWGNPGYSLFRGVTALGGGEGFIDFASQGAYPDLYERYWQGSFSNWTDESSAEQCTTVDESGW